MIPLIYIIRNLFRRLDQSLQLTVGNAIVILLIMTASAMNQTMEQTLRNTGDPNNIKMQSGCGIDALQIFDSWQALCPDKELWNWSLKWIDHLVRSSPESLPLIVYANSSISRLREISKTGCNALGVHHRASIIDARNSLPNQITLQGNLPPELMETDRDTVSKKTKVLLDQMNGDTAHILNLGHGIRPGAKIECMESLVETTRNYSNEH